ncbi:MAG: hypothetical protein IPJ45_07410 [Ignavibacteria bacterium]|nr:hypothetical protein [Ignavibacteria bacterium]
MPPPLSNPQKGGGKSALLKSWLSGNNPALLKVMVLSGAVEFKESVLAKALTLHCPVTESPGTTPSPARILSICEFLTVRTVSSPLLFEDNLNVAGSV